MGIVATESSTSNEKTAHTPGPWIVRKFQGVDWVVDSIPDAGGKFVGNIIAGPLTNPRWEANARLIAAAPTMRAALQSFMSLHDIDPDRYAGTDSPMLAVVEQVRAAIAKAEGK